MKRKFIIDQEEVEVPDSNIKKYYHLGQCFKKVGEEILPLPGHIYLSEDGELCDCEDCNNEIAELVNEEGTSLDAKISFSGSEGIKGFPYENKLYFLNQIQEVQV